MGVAQKARPHHTEDERGAGVDAEAEHARRFLRGDFPLLAERGHGTRAHRIAAHHAHDNRRRCAPRQSKEDAAWAGSKPAHGSGQPGFYNKHGERHKREKGGDQNIHTVSNPSFGSGRSLCRVKEQCSGGAKDAEGQKQACKVFFHGKGLPCSNRFVPII